MNPRFIILSVLFVTLILLVIGVLYQRNQTKATAQEAPKVIEVEGKPKVKYPQDFTIVLLGDSMTEALGNSDELKADLKRYYPDKTFEVLNYGYGSTNILSVIKRLEETTFHNRDFRPITEIDFDLILIESFGNNPLSEYSLEEGFKKQNQALEQAVNIIKTQNPKAKIVFMSTVAPSKQNYGKNQVDLSSEQREQWVAERISYIKNHQTFAESYGIPYIDIYLASLNEYGDANPTYIRTDDNIHPSPSGVVFISKQIADFIYNNKILP